MNSSTRWFLIGCLSLGLLIGFMAGLSISPVVSTVLSLVFAFTGGSVIVLVKGREASELQLIGQSLAAISVAMVLGVVFGIVFRVNNLLHVGGDDASAGKQAELATAYYLKNPITVKDVLKFSKMEVDPVVIRALLRANDGQPAQRELTAEDVVELLDKSNKVHPKVIEAMLDESALYETSGFMLSLQDIESLSKSGIHPQVISDMIKKSDLHPQSSWAASASVQQGAQQGTWLYGKDDKVDVIDRFGE